MLAWAAGAGRFVLFPTELQKHLDVVCNFRELACGRTSDESGPEPDEG